MSVTEEQWAKWNSNIELRLDIGETVPESFDRSGYCDSKNYRAFEQRVIEHLKAQGWTVIREFWNADADSFGPLVRLAKFRNPEGKIVELCHG